MGVPNSREYNYYHTPNTPFKIMLKRKYRYLSKDEKNMLSCWFRCLCVCRNVLFLKVLSQSVLCYCTILLLLLLLGLIGILVEWCKSYK